MFQDSTPNLKLSPDEESDIAGLLSSTPQPIQDLMEFDDVVKPVEENVMDKEDEELAGATSVLGDIVPPLSPMGASPSPPHIRLEDEEEIKPKEEVVKPASKRRPSKKETKAKVRPQIRPVARRQSCQVRDLAACVSQCCYTLLVSMEERLGEEEHPH